MSGSTIGGLAGGVIGFFAGGPAGARWGFMLGSAAGGYLDPAQIEGPRLRDAQVQTSDEGVPRPIIYGVYAVAGNLIQRGPLIERKKTERQGKGGPEVTTYSYLMSYAIRVCEGPVAGISRIWRDDKLVYDVRAGSTFNADTAAFATKLTIYLGDESQLPDPTLEALPADNGGGVGNVPAHRGTCYVVFENDDLTDRNGTIPQYRFEVMSLATETPSVCPASWVLSSNSYSSAAAVVLASDVDDFGSAAQNLAGVDDGSGRHVTVGDGRVFLNGGVSAIGYSDDSLQTFANGYATGLQTGSMFPHYWEGNLWIPLGFNGYSVTSGPTGFFSGSIDVGLFASIGSRLFAADNSGGDHKYRDAGDSGWTSATQAFGFSQPAMVSSGSLCVVLSRNSSAVPTVYLTADFEDWDSYPSPFTQSGGTAEDRFVGAYGDGTFVFVNYDGQIAYGSGSSLSLSGDTFPNTPMAVAYGDGHFVIVGSGGACMVSSEKGVTWTTKATGFGSTQITGVAYMGGMPGTEIPDAPGFYVQEDGSILQRCTSAELAADTTILSTVVQDICTRVGLDASEHLSLSALTDSLTGYAISRQMPATEALKPLQQVYFFDLPEWGDYTDAGPKIRAVKRGGAIVKTLEDDDFVQSDGDEETRGQAVEFPRKLNLYHADPDANYARVPAPAERVSENVKATGEMAIEAPLALTRAEAAPISAIQLKVAWERMQGTMHRKLPAYAHADLVPSDCIGYGGKRWMIDRIEATEGVLDVEFSRDRASAYESTATPNTIVTPTPPPSSIAGPTKFAALNLPRLRSSDTGPGMYVGVCGLLDGWQGADLYLSVDGGVTEQLVASIGVPSTLGYLLEDSTDDALSVRLYDGELDSVTFDQLVARQNAAAVTTGGVSEVIQFQTAEEDSNGDYALSDLIRAGLGTDEAAHVAADGFAMLAGLTFLPLDVGLAGSTLIFRPVSRGTTPANNPTYSVVFQPQFIGSPVVEAYTDDLDETYTDNNGNSYAYEVPDEVP